MINTLDSKQLDFPPVINPELQKRLLVSISNILETTVTANNISAFVPSLGTLFVKLTPSKVKRLIAMTLIMAGTYSVNAQTEDVLPISTTVSVDSLRLRESPSLQGEILGYLNTDDNVNIIGFDSSDLWAMVSTDEDLEPEGFVYKMYLRGFGDDVIELDPNTALNANLCVVNGIARDSGLDLCSTPYFGTTILYAHNWSVPGQTLLSLYQSPEGTLVDINIEGVNYGNYQVVSHYESSGQEIANILDARALNSQNNEFITLVTTDPLREGIDASARRVTLLQRVVPTV